MNLLGGDFPKTETGIVGILQTHHSFEVIKIKYHFAEFPDLTVLLLSSFHYANEMLTMLYVSNAVSNSCHYLKFLHYTQCILIHSANNSVHFW